MIADMAHQGQHDEQTEFLLLQSKLWAGEPRKVDRRRAHPSAWPGIPGGRFSVCLYLPNLLIPQILTEPLPCVRLSSDAGSALTLPLWCSWSRAFKWLLFVTSFFWQRGEMVVSRSLPSKRLSSNPQLCSFLVGEPQPNHFTSLGPGFLICIMRLMILPTF